MIPIQQTSAGRPEQPKSGRPSSLDEFAKGKLLLALAAGLSRREAAACVGCSYSAVQYMVDHDAEFAEELELYAAVAKFHPHLIVFRAAGNSWKGAVCLLEHLQKRHGDLTTDRMLDMLSSALEQGLKADRES